MQLQRDTEIGLITSTVQYTILIYTEILNRPMRLRQISHLRIRGISVLRLPALLTSELRLRLGSYRTRPTTTPYGTNGSSVGGRRHRLSSLHWSLLYIRCVVAMSSQAVATCCKVFQSPTASLGVVRRCGREPRLRCWLSLIRTAWLLLSGCPTSTISSSEPNLLKRFLLKQFFSTSASEQFFWTILLLHRRSMWTGRLPETHWTRACLLAAIYTFFEHPGTCLVLNADQWECPIYQCLPMLTNWGVRFTSVSTCWPWPMVVSG